MFQTQKEVPVTVHRSHPRHSGRKITSAPVFVPDFHNTFSENTRSETLGYTKESHADTGHTVPPYSLSHAPIQTKPDPQPEESSAMSKDSFFGTLTDIIKGHINSAQLASKNPTPAHKRLWDSIIKDFETYANIETLISKILSFNTPGVENPNDFSSVYNTKNYEIYLSESGQINHAVSNAFNALNNPISQTLNDIFYWTCLDGAQTVTKITLTDSDLHHRGVGVCIVEYRTDSGQNKLVVKPEDKSFEKLVYDKNPESLANEFNNSLAAGALGDTFTNSSIGTLGIQTSQNNEHGSAMEFFEHQQFKDIVANKQLAMIDNRSVESLIAFSSLLGLADLHVENAVYSKDASNPFSIQLIDAEIGMKYLLSSDQDFALLETAMKSGEMLGYAPSVDSGHISRKDFSRYHPDALSRFLDSAKDKLKNARSRIVLLATPVLFQYRTQFLAGIEDWYLLNPGNKNDTYSSQLLDAAKNYYHEKLTAESLQQEDVCKSNAEMDFASGRIPFFELEFSSGTVSQILPEEKIPIVTYKNTKENITFLETMIESRRDALTQEHAAIQMDTLAQEHAETQMDTLAQEHAAIQMDALTQEHAAIQTQRNRFKIGSATLLCAAAGSFFYLYFKK